MWRSANTEVGLQKIVEKEYEGMNHSHDLLSPLHFLLQCRNSGRITNSAYVIDVFSCSHLVGEIKLLMSYCAGIIRHEMFAIDCHDV